MKKNNRLILLVTPFFFGIIYFYRKFFFSNFDLVNGDQGDGRFVALVTNHWFRVFTGESNWQSLDVFFPTDQTIGLSDLKILLAIPHLVFRIFGFDIFLSFTFTTMIFTFIGYISLYILLTRYFKIQFLISIFASFLFTFSSPNVIALSSHPQLFTIYLTPLLLIGFAKILKKRNTLLNIILTFLLLGLIFSTAVYIFIFIILSLLIFTFLYGILEIKSTSIRVYLELIDFRSMLFALSSLLLGMSPGLWVYLPTRNTQGGRDISEILEYASSPINILNVGDNNLIWSKVLEYFNYLLNINLGSDELSLNPTPFLILFVSIISLLVYKMNKLPTILLLTAGFNLILISKFGKFAPWELLHQLRGLDSIRAISRFNLLTNLILIIALAVATNMYLKRISFNWFIIFPFASVLLLEQIQIDNNFSISRKEQSDIIELAKAYPIECDIFYINSYLTDKPQSFIQNDAFLISQVSGLPTLNGYSGVYPPGWNLNSVGDPSYIDRIREYASRQNIEGTTCELNISERRWYITENTYLEGPS